MRVCRRFLHLVQPSCIDQCIVTSSWHHVIRRGAAGIQVSFGIMTEAMCWHKMWHILVCPAQAQSLDNIVQVAIWQQQPAHPLPAMQGQVGSSGSVCCCSMTLNLWSIIVACVNEMGHMPSSHSRLSSTLAASPAYYSLADAPRCQLSYPSRQN